MKTCSFFGDLQRIGDKHKEILKIPFFSRKKHIANKIPRLSMNTWVFFEIYKGYVIDIKKI